MKYKRKNLHLFLLFIICIIIIYSTYMHIYYGNTDFDQLLFTAKYGLSNSDFTPVYDAILKTTPFLIGLFIILYYLFYKVINQKKRKIYSIILIVITIFITLFNFNLFSYSYYKFTKSNFIEDNYVNPKTTKINLNQKKNLILIVLESFESTIANKQNGGSYKYNLIPEISKLNKEKDVTYFKTKNNKYGQKMINGATFTSSSLITNTSGIPFKYYNFSTLNKNKFLSGAYTLGDLLKDNGYHNELISSANTDFGGVNTFFTIHGNYNIIDINTYKDYNLTITKNDLLDWGFNDNYLFETAKKRLNIISQNNKPFNLTLVGVDTHFPRGYLTNYTIKKYKKQYENVYATEDILITNFINWLKKQDFYKDTTIVIIGDHISMEENFFKNINEKDRYVYTSYINTIPNNYNENRTYTALDTYPTILGAMGATIEDNQLGLGINMFSDKPTLAEKYSYNYLNKELKKGSNFYKKEIYEK